MLTLKNFKVNQTVYILYFHHGYVKEPEIIETTVEKVGRKYVTVKLGNRKFERRGDIYALSEVRDFGECGYLFDDYVMADIERERNEWIIDIRQMMRFLYKCSYNDLNTIREILKKASEKMNG